jgi:hypothetical protein
MKTIVSLTSFPARLPATIKVIESMMSQTLRPDKIVLYLTSAQFPDKSLPNELAELCDGNFFDIRFCDKPFKCYTKLVPALQDFPNDIIITVDDDMIYPPDLIERLVAAHKKYPNAVVGHDVRRMRLNKSYKKWRKIQNKWWRKILFGRPSYLNFAAGVGGVLYPPHSLHPDTIKDELFWDLAPNADDVWFWAMAVLNGTKIALVPDARKESKIIDNSQEVSLWSENSQNNRNNQFLDAIVKHYPALRLVMRNA